MTGYRITKKARRYLASREQREAQVRAEWLVGSMRAVQPRSPEQQAANARKFDELFPDDEQPRPCYNIARSRS